MKLEPLILKGFFDRSICKLAQDECYPNANLRQGPNKPGSVSYLRSGDPLNSSFFPKDGKGK